MSWLQRVVWVFLVALMAASAIGLLVGRGLYLDTEDISTPAFLVMGVVGAWISVRRPANPIGWLFLASAATASLLMWAESVVADTLASGGQWEGAALWALLCTDVAWYVSFALIVVYVPLLFPDGPLSPAWRRIVIGLAVSQGLFVILATVSQNLEPTEGVVVSNPLALPTPAVEDTIGNLLGGIGLALQPIGLFLGLVSLVLRYRRADAVERLQLRWFVAAVTFLLLAVLVLIVASSVVPDGSLLQVLIEVAFGLSLVALPVACAVAVLRYRLYEIDRIVSRTVSYLIVSLLILGTYAVVVASVSTLLQESNTLAVAGATLAAAAVFRPVLRRVQGVVDRRFNRARYDATREIEGYSSSLRDFVDPDEVAVGLVAALDRTLQPAVVGVWRGSPS